MQNYDKQTIIRTCEGIAFEFHCYTNDLRDGYIERATMCDPFTSDLYNGTCRVWNRPWQSWTYQTACDSAVGAAIEEERQTLEWAWKNAHGYQRMTQKRREEFEGSPASSSDRLRALLTLKWTIGDHVPHMGLSCVGYREIEILDHLSNVEHIETNADHEVYRLYGENGHYFEWDQATHTVVG